MNIFIDASHACHENMRGQTGGCITMGKGVLHARSSKQTLNSKSSTETELIGNSDYLPYALWYIYFFRSQGYEIKYKILYQDNESTIKLLNNGKRSSGKQTRHIDIRYFWISDRLKSGAIKVKYCPTECMLADFFTKPLGGSLFATMRDICQDNLEIEELSIRHNTKIKKEIEENSKQQSSGVHKECVGQNVKIEDKNKNKNGHMIQYQVMKGELTNEIQDQQVKRKERNSCNKNAKCDDNANCERTNVGINTDTLRKIDLKDNKHLHTHEDIKNKNTLDKNEKGRRVKEQGLNNEKYEEKNKENYKKDTIKNIQDDRPRKNKNEAVTTYASIVKKSLRV